MSLNEDPKLTVKMLQEGNLCIPDAQKKIKDLISEVSSGIYTFEQMGLNDEIDLQELLAKAKGFKHKKNNHVISNFTKEHT
jgi:hypothetical protein